MKKNNKIVTEGGATRTDDVKARHELVPPVIMDVLAERFTKGAISHGSNNWKKGGTDFILSCFGRLENHKSRLINSRGMNDDDDLAAMMWNVCVLAWFRGNKPDEYDEALGRMK